MSDIFTKILQQAATNSFSDEKEAALWFRNKALEVSKSEVSDLMKQRTDHYRTSIVPGYMYAFYYDPKYKETLPYYDRFPLIFPLSMEKDSFLGINVHYLPPVLRAKLMDAIYPFITNNKLPEKRKLEISYQILKGSSANKYIKPCIKRYLKSHVRSRFMKIDSNEWNIALMLKTAKFEKKSAAMVWNDSWNAIK